MKRTVVVSNACFSDGISNGRTLASLFAGADPERLAQFFVYGVPDSKVCNNYYQVSDRDALHSLNPFRKCGGIVEQSEQLQGQRENISPKRGRRTPLKMFLRECVWLMGNWKSRLWQWLDDFRPEVVCIFLANSIFLIRLTIQVAKRYKIPVIVYTTEGYYFMNYNYFTNRPSMTYKVYYAWLRAAYHKLTPFIEQGFFNSTFLRDEYEREFHYPCKCVMNSSNIEFVPHIVVEPGEEIKVSYLGNLGLKRHKALIEIAEILQELDSRYYLDVYGSAPNDDVIDELKKCSGIRYHGYITYNEVVRIIHDSTLLVHAEWNDAIANRDLKYAFSTKIADSISGGTPLLIYASESLAETVFLRDNQCAFIANDKNMLRDILPKALTDTECRCKIVENAKVAKEKYLTGNSVFLQAFE